MVLIFVEKWVQSVNKNNIKGVFKFQFRQLDTFIHHSFKGRNDVKHLSRFENTKLDRAAYEVLRNTIKDYNMLSMATPFDEESIHWIHELEIDIIKVASCSALDRPLLKAISQAGKPVIISTGGLTINEIDSIVAFFETNNINFALMHCISIYPTPNEMLQLNQVSFFKKRYPNIPIGWSTHENQDDIIPITIAKSKGAQIFERHVGIENSEYKLNAYSSTPQQIEKWVKAYKYTVDALGGNERCPSPITETNALKSLYRGIWCKRDIEKGHKIERDDVYFAMPLQPEQMTSGNWKNGMVANKSYKKDEPLNENLVDLDPKEEDIIFELMLQVKAMLNQARIFVNNDASVEISHHYGINRFREFGCIIINCINREYAKKLIIQLPRQKHPYHYHKKKEETFQLLYGDLEVEINGNKTKLKPGDTFLVERLAWHKFHTLHGAIFEEISTTHFNNDSFYEDKKIESISRNKRKTNVNSWAKAFSSQSN